MKKIIAICAHPDDFELFMFGLMFLIKKTKLFSIKIIIATDGALGGEVTGPKLAEIRKKETLTALTNFSKPVFLDLPDGQLNKSLLEKNLIRDQLLKTKPDLVFTHSPNDYHSDHRNLSSIVIDVVDFRAPIIFCDNLMGVNFSPDFYVDITKVFSNKKTAILCHKSQKPKRFLNAIELQNSFRSAQCNRPLKTFAEAYKVYKSFPRFNVEQFIPNLINPCPFNISQSQKKVLI